MLLNARQRRIHILTMAENNKKLHREQLLEKYRKKGLDGLSESQKLELLLSYAQVAEPAVLAAELLSEYGSINALADADTALLMKNPDVNEQTAVLLRLIPCISRAMYSERFTVKTLSTTKAAKKYFASHCIGAVGEKLIMTGVNSRFRISVTKVLAFGSASRLSASFRDIAEMAVKSSCDIFFLAHNHPHGVAEPSDSDVLFTKNAIKTLSKVGAVLADHIIVGADAEYSMRENSILPEMPPNGIKGYKCGK